MGEQKWTSSCLSPCKSNQSFQEDQVEWKEPKHHLPLKDFLGSSRDLACWAISGWGFLPPNSAILQLSPFVHTQHLHNLALCNCGNLFGHVLPPGDHITMSHRALFTLAWVAFLPFVSVDRLCDWGCVQLYTHCSYCKLGPRDLAFGHSNPFHRPFSHFVPSWAQTEFEFEQTPEGNLFGHVTDGGTHKP